VLDPDRPVESAPLPYSIQTDPSPIVTESGCVPLTGLPVAKTDELAVSPACADALIAKNTMLPNTVLITSVMVSLHVIDKQFAHAYLGYRSVRFFHDRELTIYFLFVPQSYRGLSFSSVNG
jgi:hypothetical protein